MTRCLENQEYACKGSSFTKGNIYHLNVKISKVKLTSRYQDVLLRAGLQCYRIFQQQLTVCASQLAGARKLFCMRWHLDLEYSTCNDVEGV